MKPSVFKELAQAVYDGSGIRIRDGKQLMVASRLVARLRALELGDEEQYLVYLRENLDEELVQLLDVISTNVTHFFREAEHFEILRAALDQWLAAGQTRIRIWCAASSTGEEPYSLAITVREALAHARRKADVRILATDISTRVLRVAKEGLYEDEKVEPIPKNLRLRYFERRGDSEGVVWRARDELRDLLLFRRLNLSEPPFAMKGPLDAIFCRNVMIYFDEGVRRPLISEFRRLLRPDGLLIVGKSESLTRSNAGFERAGPSVYRPTPGQSRGVAA
jgi:chemotaxis protein methyltransferase CheR